MTHESQDPQSLMQQALKFLAILFKPVVASARGYGPRKLRGDMIVRLTVAVVAVPQSMA